MKIVPTISFGGNPSRQNDNPSKDGAARHSAQDSNGVCSLRRSFFGGSVFAWLIYTQGEMWYTGRAGRTFRVAIP